MQIHNKKYELLTNGPPNNQTIQLSFSITTLKVYTQLTQQMYGTRSHDINLELLLRVARIMNTVCYPTSAHTQ